MKSITFIKTSMQSGKIIELSEYEQLSKGIRYIEDLAQELNYTNRLEEENQYRKVISYGGIAHDYRLELEIIK